MAGIFIKEDLRKIKTQKSIRQALMNLLQRRNFREITVNDICEEALVSRSAFYAHCQDKYDLLTNMLGGIAAKSVQTIESYLETFVYSNSKLIKNIFENADEETLEIIYMFALNCLMAFAKISDQERNDQKFIVYANFCVGGILCNIMRQIKSDTPINEQETKKYFEGLVTSLLAWNK